MGVIQLPKFAHPDFIEPGRKPVGPVEIDRGSYYGNRTVLAAYASAKNLAGYEMGTLSGKIAANQIDMTSSGYLDFSNTDLDTAGGFLLAMRFKAISPTTWGRIFSTKTAYNSTNGLELTFNNGATDSLRFQLLNNEFYNYSLPSGVTTADTLTFTLVYEPANAFLHMETNGVATTGLTISPLGNETLETMISDAGGSGKAKGNLLLDYCFFAEGNFTAAHMNKAHNDPYGVFLKPAIPLEAFYGSAAAGSSFQAAWARNANQIIQVGI